MDIIIYRLPTSNQILEVRKEDIQFDDHPSPKLLKYGFNVLGDRLDWVALTSDPHYKAGLRFDFSRSDPESIVSLATATLRPHQFDQTFAEFWEIICLFDLLKNQQILSTNQPEIMEDIIAIQKKTKDIRISTKIKDRLHLIIQKYSDVDLDEDTLVTFITKDLSSLFERQVVGANMVLQISSIQTQIMAELVYYLSTLYVSAYIVRPMVIPEISNSKYLVLVGLRQESPWTIFPRENAYLSSIISSDLPTEFNSVIQCMNSYLIPLKFTTYSRIQSYLKEKIYEGATYQEFTKIQNEMARRWIDIYSEPSKAKALLDNIIERTEKTCNYQRLEII